MVLDPVSPWSLGARSHPLKAQRDLLPVPSLCHPSPAPSACTARTSIVLLEHRAGRKAVRGDQQQGVSGMLSDFSSALG